MTSKRRSHGEPMGSVARNSVLVKMIPELKELVLAEATARGISMGEWFVRLAAKHFRRDDLSAVPRKSFGRPPKNRSLA